MTDEQSWRDIPGFEGRYQVSSLGEVRSLRFRNKQTDTLRQIPRLLKQQLAPNGYRYVWLGGRNIRKVSTLVLVTFVGPRPGSSRYINVAHLNGIRTDDRLSNLRWVTSQENNAHRIAHGTMNYGERCGRAKATEAQIHKIRRSSLSSTRLAERFRLSERHIRKIRAGETWSYLSEDSVRQ